VQQVLSLPACGVPDCIPRDSLQLHSMVSSQHFFLLLVFDRLCMLHAEYSSDASIAAVMSGLCMLGVF